MNNILLLINQAQKGSEKAFLEIVGLYEAEVRIFFAARLPKNADLDDLIQETFIAAHRNLHTLEEPEFIKAWLKGIARNKLKMYFRSLQRRDRMQAEFKEFISDCIHEELDQEERERNSLKTCLKKLPEHLKDLIIRRHLKNEKVKDIARDSGRSESAVSVALHRARQSLRQCLERRTAHG